MMEIDPSGFHFLRPWWLCGIVVAVWCAYRYQRRRGAGSGWRAAIEPSLLTALLEGTSERRRRTLAAIIGLTLAAASIGLAGPTMAKLPQPVEQREDALVIVLDLSLSMLASDTSPTRIVRARHKVADLLAVHTEGFVALVAYAGDAHVVSPLTDDRRTITNLLNSLSPEMMPVLGSRPDDAIALAHELLTNAGIIQGRIVLITDGIERIGDITRHASRQMPISILGIGTEAGGQIPLDFVDQPGQVLRDDQGRPVVARLDVERLEAVAELTHGSFSTLEVGDRDIRHLLGTRLPGPAETTEIEREFDTWADAGYWFALALLPFALLAFRRGVLVGVALIIAPPADASWWDDLWLRPDQQGHAALLQGEPERAATLFEDSHWRGVANYRSNDFERAEQAFATDSSATGHYNRGNALARLNNLPAAIEAYDSALALDPDHEDAAFNKALLDQQQQQQQQQDSEGQSGDESEPGQAGDPNAANMPNQPPTEPTDPEAGQPEDAESSEQSGSDGSQLAQQEVEAQARDESDEAAEQWLRRVPDDPGGLLRRKFKYETNQRLRRGEYQSRQQERIW